MRRATALKLTVATAVVGALGVVAVAVAVTRSDDGGDQVSAIDPGAATRLARDPVSTPAPSTPAAATSSTAAVTPRSVPAAQQRPTRVSIGGVDIRAAVIPVGVAKDGQVDVPEDVTEVGWYRFSSAPGDAAGSAVLVGHVDSAEEGEGAFFRLRDARRGETVLVRTATGRTLTYRVISREQFPKPDVPLNALFARTGKPRLTLITCGGSFDETRRSYRDNVVVTAVPQ